MLKIAITINYFAIAGLAYFGSINPYPLGLLSSFGVATALIALSLLLATLLGAQSLWFKLIHSLLVVVCGFVVISNWYYFDYFRLFYTHEVLYMGADLFAGSNALNIPDHLSSSKILIGVLALSLIPILLIRKHQNSNFSWVIVLALCSATSLSLVENGLAQYRDRGVNWLLPANLHPIHAFFNSSADNSEISPSEIEANEYFGALNKTLIQQNQVSQSREFAPGVDEYNVLVILLESFRADLTGIYGQTALTPHFDKIVEQSLLAEQHISNTTHTVSAEINIWCGFYDLIGERKLTYQADAASKLKCLPEKLKALGYQTLYFHGNTGEFYNRNELLPKIGFQTNYFHKDEIVPAQAGTKIGWGVDDGTMFNTVLGKLDSLDNDKPFVAHFTTLSNHYPFKWNFSNEKFTAPFADIDANSTYQNYQNMIAYTDFALGQFWSKFQQSKLSKNTIVVISGDHGIWEFGNENYSLAEKNERFFRMPLAIIHPNQKGVKRFSDVSSHIDIPVTLSEMLKVKPSAPMLGRSLLAKYKHDNWAIASKGVDIVFRKKDTACFQQIDECSLRQQECQVSAGELNLFSNQTQREACISLNGDPLAPSSSQLPTNISPEYKMARDYKSYLNKSRLRSF